MTPSTDPVRPTDEAARSLGRALLAQSRTAALAVIHPDTGAPFVSRIAWAPAPDRGGLGLVSDLSLHTRALRSDPRAAVLLGEPGGTGDPLNHPRLSLTADNRFVARSSADRAVLREHWLRLIPAALTYIDFDDFSFVRFDLRQAALNAGFARAYLLSAQDLHIS